MEPSDPTFYHPYQPYRIQQSFMSNLYDCIEQRKVGIFESPTGTGKSLSLICGSLTWLRNHKRRLLEGELDGVADDPEDWLAQAEKQNRRRELLRDREELEQKLTEIRREEERRRISNADRRLPKKPRQDGFDPSEKPDEDEFMLVDYDSDDGVKQKSGLSRETQALLDDLTGQTRGKEDETVEEETKVIFCSRTHSQLTQFVNELRRVKLPLSVPWERTAGDAPEPLEAVKHLPLGSRKNLCINDKVLRLSSAAAISERCIELQKAGTAKEHKCQYLPTRDDQGKVDSFRDRAIAQIRDIEDVASLGREMQICPYYATRTAIAPSEVLTLPYPLLLQKSAREALGVSVKDNVVVIDEAHNLMDAIADTFSISMWLSQLRLASQQVTNYVQRFRNRLKGRNRVYVAQVIRLLNSMVGCLETIATSTGHQDVNLSASQLMAGKGVDQIKPHKLLVYLQESKLAHKIEGYTEASKTSPGIAQQKGMLMLFQNFLIAMMNPAAEGRFFASRQENDVTVRYTLLDPREHFRDVVENARAVILAGGTMSPMSDYSEHLFSYLTTDRLQTFSFGHVIPKENLFAQAVIKGPSGVDFEFTFQKRGDDSMISELGQMMLKVCQTVPDGIVVFLPSYDYLAQVVRVWKQHSILSKLHGLKPVFEESRGASIEDLLREYAQTIDAGRGGLLLSVVGGKLSEGINFSDKLGRAVVAVGLPFPNANGAEWKAKLQHIESTKYKQCKAELKLAEKDCQTQAKAAGRDFYENACMRAVNQSIGRAIRHRNDYAAILLVDRRFATVGIMRKLPGWIRGSMNPVDEERCWISAAVALKFFFDGKH